MNSVNFLQLSRFFHFSQFLFAVSIFTIVTINNREICVTDIRLAQLHPIMSLEQRCMKNVTVLDRIS